jgi:isoquinoline 1-oxidoreductase beta subunit
VSGSITLGRRGFLKVGAAIGGGLIVGFHLRSFDRLADAAMPSTSTFVPNAFIRIGTDDAVTVMVNKSEMGQGVYTPLPTLVAEELDADWRKVRVESAPVAPMYNHTRVGIQMTGGSTSIWSSWEQLRQASATARAMLVMAAAQTWQVDPASCRTENGIVTYDASQRRLSYGQLAAKASEMTPPAAVTLKDPKDFKLIGKPTPRLDTPEKASGQAIFGIDMQVPGMLRAVLARPPVFGAKLKHVNVDKAKAVPGVKAIVPIDAGVAVVADGFWSANQARDLLGIWRRKSLDSNPRKSGCIPHCWAEALADVPSRIATSSARRCNSQRP